MKRNVMITLIFVVLIGIGSSPISATSEPALENGRELIAAYDPRLPPFHFHEDGDVTGFAVEVLEEVAARENMHISYEPMVEREALASLEADEIDIILSMSYSEQHAESLEFSNSYYSSSVGLFVPREKRDIESVADVSGQTVALKRESVEREFLQNIRRVHFNETSSLDHAVELAVRGRADAVVGEVKTTERLLERRGKAENYVVADNYLVPLEYSFATSSEDYQTLRSLNNGLQAIHNDGTYQELFSEWFPEEDSQRDQLWLALQILGAAFLGTAVVIVIGVRLNRKLQREVERQTEQLNEANRSLKEQVEATKNSNEFQKQILQSSPRGMMTINEEGVITSFNPKAAFILNSEEEMVGLSYEKDPLLDYFLHDKLTGVLIYGKQFLGEESTWVREDGIRLRLRAYIYPLYNFEQDIVGVMFTFEDISEEIQVRQQAFENEKNLALSRVVAGIAHEIRNPLTSIKAFIDLIPYKFQSEKFREKVSTLVPQEIERLNDLIEGLMDYSKSRPVAQERLDTSDLLEGCHLLFEGTAANKGIAMELSIEKDLVILADRQQMKQAIINLIINAIDALADHDLTVDKKIYLRNYQEDDNICMEITDTGPGMSEHVQRQAFEPFYTTKAEGTGLGLAIAKQHVEENNGFFYVKSEPDNGTCIQLVFPTYATTERVG
ncbi:transporter substrate-binding domain-containing protein [Salsuginibacillus kocurii]|uniref:transporter substrate-binding domain-containing protein n=1 Tax=Salsuginibacillus kocurii TaxID=427078 RepID=UPI000368314D|nr:transporter substrate-binding domain-containing protein [Salsuginibacillus kocurii]